MDRPERLGRAHQARAGRAVYRPHELNSLEEVRIMLAERVVDWTQQWKQEGRQEGLHIQRNLKRWPCQSIR
jgi:hypothetical protein